MSNGELEAGIDIRLKGNLDHHQRFYQAMSKKSLGTMKQMLLFVCLKPTPMSIELEENDT